MGYALIMRSLPVGLAELLRGGWAESHSTLELTVSPMNEPARTYYLATSRITVNGVAHDAYLRETGSVRYSLTAAADLRMRGARVASVAHVFSPMVD